MHNNGRAIGAVTSGICSCDG